MPAATLNQFRCELPSRSCHLRQKLLVRLAGLLSFVRFSALLQCNLLALTTFAVPKRELLFFWCSV
jgi:hypothetical protein